MINVKMNTYRIFEWSAKSIYKLIYNNASTQDKIARIGKHLLLNYYIYDYKNLTIIYIIKLQIDNSFTKSYRINLLNFTNN